MTRLIFIIYLSTALIFPFGALDRIVTQFLVLNFLNLIFVPLIFLKKIKRNELNFGFSMVELLFFGLFVLGIATSFVATDKSEVVVVASQILNYLSAAFVLRYFIKKENLKVDYIINVFIIFLVLEVSYVLISYAHNSIEIGNFNFSRGGYIGFFSNINITSFSIVLKLPFIFCKLYEKTSFLKHLKYFLTLTLSILALVILNSRGAYLAFFAIVILFLLFNVKNFRQIWRPLLSVLVAFGISVLFSIKFSSNNMVQRLSSINIENTTNVSSIGQRLYYYENALTSIFKDPLGIGLGNWKLLGTKYAREIVDGFIVPYHVHNDFLEIGAELGILGFILYISIPLILVFSFLRKNIFDKYRIAFFSSYVVFLIDSLFNFPFSRLGIMIQVMVFIIILEHYTFDSKRFSVRASDLSKKILGILAFVALSVSIFFSYKTYKSFVYSSDLLADFNSGNFIRDTEFIENIPSFPNMTPTTFPVKALKANYYLYKGESKKALEIINKSQSSNLGFKENVKSRILLLLNQVDSSYYYSKLALDKLPNNALHFLIFSANAAIRKDTNELRLRYANIKQLSDTLQPVFYIKSLMKSGVTFNDEEIDLAKRVFKTTQDNMIKNLVIELKYGKIKKQYIDSLYLKADEQFKIKNFNSSISNYETILNTIGFEEYAVFENLGLAYHLNKQYKKAIEKFDIVIDSFNIKTGNSELYKALSLYDLKEISKACNLLYQSEILGNKKARTLRQSLCK